MSEDYELPATYQKMFANGWLGSTNQTVGSYYPTDEDELAMEGTTYYLWIMPEDFDNTLSTLRQGLA